MRHIGLTLVLVACAHNVPQDKATGPDGKQKGAVPVALVENEAKVKGVVTYPGGDRIDWKKIELPQGTKGKLDLTLTWDTPRPGLRVAFDVFDQWNTPVVPAAKKPAGRMQDASIDVAKGTYYVRIYAPRRKDAGSYKLVANFTPEAPAVPPDMTVPDPPKLPAIPVAEPGCDVFDPSVKACEKVCPEFGAPAGWKACADKEKAEKEQQACEEAQKARIEAMKNAPKSMDKRIIDVKVNGDEATITIAAGTDGQALLDKSWKGEVLNTQTGKPLVGGTVTIVRVGKLQTLAKVNLSVDRLNQNPTVRLTPPAFDQPAVAACKR
ncbi:MAG TPA: hypothetical protein VMZ53_14960 [Kofleriaceae bacterium]|nr:hypothetical protein [Kofleriaceae bacterium]